MDGKQVYTYQAQILDSGLIKASFFINTCTNALIGFLFLHHKLKELEKTDIIFNCSGLEAKSKALTK